MDNLMDPKLYKAVRYGDVTGFENFISTKDNDPSSSVLLKETHQKNTVLHVAALYSQTQIAQQIIHHHPSLLYSTNSEEDTPLHLAARVGCLEIVELLLNCAGRNREVELADQVFSTRMLNAAKDTVLHDAVRNGHLDVVKLLIQKDPGLALISNHVTHESPLFLAVEKMFFTIAKHLLQHAEQCSFEGRDGMNALHAAILRWKGRFSKISYGIFVNLLSRSLWLASSTDEDFSAEKMFFTIAKYLLLRAEQCSFEGRDGMNALHAASLRCKGIFFKISYGLVNYLHNRSLRLDFSIAAMDEDFSDMLNEMVRKYPTAVVEADNLECTPLHYAACLGCVEAVELFLTDESLVIYNNDFVYKENKEGMSAFHVAAMYGHVGVMRKLIEICPDISEPLNSNGQTALHVAVQGGKKIAVQYLLKMLGAEVVLNKQDKDGNTPLHLAAKLEDSPILFTLLIENRVDANVVNNEGLAAVDIILSSTEPHTYLKMERILNLVKIRGGLPNLRGNIIGRNMGNTQNSESEKQPTQNGEETNRKQVRKRNYGFLNSPKYAALKEASSADMLTATIIATVTFAAAFQVPGGYESGGSYQGLPLLRNKPRFVSFIILDSFAFCLSTTSIYLHIIALRVGENANRLSILKKALILSSSSIAAMIGAFFSALLLVSGNSVGIKFSAYLCVFTFLLGCLYVVYRRKY